jgi:predicted nucleic acid-binding protein
MNAYIDTSVMLARYIPNDPDRVSCTKFFKETEIEKLASPLTLLELTCTFSRLLEAKEIEVPSQIEAQLEESSYEENVQSLVEYTIKECGLRIADVIPFPVTLSLLGSSAKVSHEYLKALKLASQLRLKTLDTLHLAYISCLRDEGVRVEYLVTNDKEILAREKRVLEVLESRVISGEEASTLLLRE